MRDTEVGGKPAEISILLPSISPKLKNVLNFDLTGRYVDMRLDRRSCNLGDNNISDNILRPFRILVHLQILYFSQNQFAIQKVKDQDI